MADDHIQHGIDDDANNDPHKAKNLGGAGGAVTGAIAGSAAGPLGTIAGAVIGGVVGAVASKAAVKEIDKHDNDDTITGIGHGATTDVNDQVDHATDRTKDATYATTGAIDGHMDAVGNGVPGVQTGGYATDGTTDTRGVTEKLADTVTGNDIDDKTGKRV